ncbi:MAG: HNH endonuclease [Parcubacteria group bacterium]
MILTADTLRQCVRYDPKTGEFTFLLATKGHPANRVARGVRPDGYRRIGVGKKLYYAHRLAVLYMTGEWPAHDVDHINGNPSDNRWANLRLATRSQNLRNQRRRRDGLKGASFMPERGKWRATIGVAGKALHLGVFDTEEAAHAAYVAASEAHHGEYGRVA